MTAGHDAHARPANSGLMVTVILASNNMMVARMSHRRTSVVVVGSQHITPLTGSSVGAAPRAFNQSAALRRRRSGSA